MLVGQAGRYAAGAVCEAERCDARPWRVLFTICVVMRCCCAVLYSVVVLKSAERE